jgi:uncharacterized protein YceK
MKGFICLVSVSVLLCCSCATVKTLDPPGNHVNISHYGKKSYCDDIPRIYSGLAYNFCLMYGEPSRTVNIGDSLNGVPFVLLDTVFSAATDTLVLPYTIVTQSQKGSIKVN